ncbi:MAG TPA: cysteine desulfurase family protein [Candidatus Limnocylindrales bacterium]
MTVYLDNASTTPLRPEALDAMMPFLTSEFGNASSAHRLGQRARAGLDEARERVATRLGVTPKEIVFTSGGTEAINLALKGAAWAGKARGHRIVTTAIEHHAVGHTLRYLEKFGFEIVELPVDRYGRVDPDELEAAITDRTILVSIMYANNEVGTVQPLAELSERVRRHRGVLFHTDAVQAAPWLDIDLRTLDVDLLALSGHKIEGPKGVGLLFVRSGTHLLAQEHGGSQERHRRAGTENVAGAVGLSVAFDLACAERPSVVPRVAGLRDCLRNAVLAIDGVELSGHPVERLPNSLSVVMRGVDGTSVALALDLDHDIACSVGSACTSGSDEVSHVLAAIGYPDEEARGALRLSLGRSTTDADVDAAIAALPGTIDRLRAAKTPPDPSALGAAAHGGTRATAVAR